MTKRKKRAAAKTMPKKKAEEKGERLVLRLPQSIRDQLVTRETTKTAYEPTYRELDWGPVHDELARWAATGDFIEPEHPDPSVQVCFHVPQDVADALREEAERLTEETGAKWTVSRVVARVLKDRGW